MDRAIPIGKRFGIGLDAILGLVPGIGDVAGGVVAGLIILQAHRAGVPKSTLLRMLANVGIDTALGAVPIIGDVFDFAYQSNMMNLELYRKSAAGVHDSRSDWTFLLLILLALGVIVSIPMLLLIWAIRWVAPF
jgi:Domain of unknown function (DUF4112)